SFATKGGSGGLIEAIWLALRSVNQTLPSGPAAIPVGKLSTVGMAISRTTWVAGLMDPRRPVALSVNQRLPSGPTAMPVSRLPGLGMANSVIAWVVGLIVPTLSDPNSTNHRLWSGPDVIPTGSLFGVVREKRVI